MFVPFALLTVTLIISLSFMLITKLSALVKTKLTRKSSAHGAEKCRIGQLSGTIMTPDEDKALRPDTPRTRQECVRLFVRELRT